MDLWAQESPILALIKLESGLLTVKRLESLTAQMVYILFDMRTGCKQENETSELTFLTLIQ